MCECKMFRIGEYDIEVYTPKWKGECWACRDENANETEYAPIIETKSEKCIRWWCGKCDGCDKLDVGVCPNYPLCKSEVPCPFIHPDECMDGSDCTGDDCIGWHKN